MSIVQGVALRCHPRTRTDAVRAIEVGVHRTDGGALAVAFRLDGDLTRVRVPPPGPPRIGRELWRHTCFEAFVAVDGGPAYHEFNFAPSGAWTAYAFRAYRDGGPLADEALAPGIAVRCAAGRLELDAVVRLDRLSPEHPRAALRLGLSAVIEDTDGARSYWALRHPAGAPDFHHAEARVLRLEPPGAV